MTIDADWPVLPEGLIYDPNMKQDSMTKYWWCINADGRRIAYNEDGSMAYAKTCPVCKGEDDRQSNCPDCSGRGVMDHVPWADRPWDEVAPNLWVGGHHCQFYGAPPLGDCIPGDTFDLVVSLHREDRADFIPKAKQIDYRGLKDEDLDPVHRSGIDHLAAEALEALAADKKVLVRCSAGINRAALVAGVVMVQMGWDADDAINHIREVRSPYALFNDSFCDYIREVASRDEASGVRVL